MSHPHFVFFVPFLSRLTAFVIAVIVAAIPMTSGSARQHVETAVSLVPRLEVVVIESEYCIYCDLFRRDVVAFYQDSPRARDVPLRFLDLADVSARKLVLAEPISVVPTVLVLRDNEELGRIPGYVGWENFSHSINYLLARER